MSRKSFILYLLTELILLCLVQAGQLDGWSNSVVQIFMYTAILINTVLTIYWFRKHGTDQNDSGDNFVAYALFVTAAADFFMTLIGTDAVFLPGVILFCLVQIIYALYLKSGVKSFLFRIALFIICLILLKKVGMLNLNNAFGLLDIILVLVNVVLAWTMARKRTTLLFRVGLTLFLCCDVSIVLRTLTDGGIHDVIAFLVWIFYIPSQVAITLSYVYGRQR